MPTIPVYHRYPVVDILPVLKGRYFSEQLKLLFYTKVAYISEVGFLFDLMKFERDPIIKDSNGLSKTDSISAISFDFSSDNKGPIVTVLLNASGQNQVYIDNNIFEKIADIITYKGNDEQGWYWGVRFTLTNGLLEKIYGKIILPPKDSIYGNIYTSLIDNELEHFVSIAPFINQNIFDTANHIEFRVL